MRATIDRKALATALAGAARIAGDGRMIPAISHVLLRAEGDALGLEATNAELSLRLSVPATVEDEGVAIVPKGIAAVVKAMAGETVRVEVTGGACTFTSGAMTTTVSVLPSSEFPSIPEPVVGPLLFAGDPMAAARRALPMASKDGSRPVLAGVLMQSAGGRRSVVATDSYRMTMWTQDGYESDDSSTIVPARAFAEAFRLDHGDGAIAVDDRLATFHLPNGGFLTTRLVDGQFPDWQQLIPEPDAWAEADRAELLSVLGRVGLMVTGTNDPVRLEFNTGFIEVSATGQIGSGKETILTDYIGDQMAYGFNAGFLIDGLRSLEGDTAKIGLLAPLRPVLLRGAGEAHQVLLMPIRLHD